MNKEFLPEVNTIAKLEFELAYFEAAAKDIDDYPTKRNGQLDR